MLILVGWDSKGSAGDTSNDRGGGGSGEQNDDEESVKQKHVVFPSKRCKSIPSDP